MKVCACGGNVSAQHSLSSRSGSASSAQPSLSYQAHAHLGKLDGHLVVHRQQLPLARLDGRISARAALGLQQHSGKPRQSAQGPVRELLVLLLST